MDREQLFSLTLFSRDNRYVWWRLPLSMALVMGVALAQHLLVLGVEQISWRYLVVPTLVGATFGTLWSVLAAYRHRLQHLVDLMRHLAEDASDVLVLRARDRFLFLSPRIRDLTGYDAEVFELTPAFFEQLVHEADRALWQAHQKQLWEDSTGAVHRLDFRLMTTLRGVVWVRHEASCFEFAGRRLCRCVLRDIGDEVHLREALQRLSDEDALTGLPNRAALVRACRRLPAGQKVCCVVVDVSRLRHINMRFGIEVGDFVLQSLAERLRGLMESEAAPGAVMAARLVGDNFVLLFAAEREAVASWLDEAAEQLNRPVFSDKLRLFIEIDVNLGCHEDVVADRMSHHQVERMLRAAYLQVHPYGGDQSLPPMRSRT